MTWYCPLPFNSISSNPAGYYALCCESDPSEMHCTTSTLSEFKNSDYMNTIRDGFLSDDPMSVPQIREACHQCISKEREGATSKRMRELIETTHTHFMELKLIGNICNYACIMCGPVSSSKIAEEVGLDIPKWFTLSDEWWDDFDKISKDYKCFKFSGGEPFMSPTTKKILNRLIKTGRAKEIDLQFNTNGSGSKKVIQRLLDNFRRVNIGFSIDAWGERNSIIRKHSTWGFTEDILWDYSDLCRTNEHFYLTIHPCISALNVGYLYEFEPFVNEACHLSNLVFSVSNTLAWPREINIANLPLEVKAKYLKDNYKFLSNASIVSNGEAVINLLQTESKNLLGWSPEWISKNVPDWKKWYPEYVRYE
jgi:hypothetical protein